jgi:hypothetical protein
VPGEAPVKDPTAKTEWTLSYCSECHQETNFCRVEKTTFRCIYCGQKKEIRELDRDRDGMLD